MNISPDGATVRFKTAPKELFEVEKSGAKPNITRILDVREAARIERAPPKKIIIQHQQEIFLRTLTDIHLNYNVLGKVIAIFSWSNEIVRDPYAHTTSLDNQPVTEDNASEIRPHAHTVHSYDEPPVDLSTTAIRLPRALIADLMSHRRMRTLPDFISALLADYIRLEKGKREVVEEEEDKKLALIGISKGMFNVLVRLAHDRSMDAVIRELYQLYLSKHAEGRGPLHD